MDKEAIRRALPEDASPEMMKWVWEHYPAELGREYLVWKAVRVRGTPPMEYLMENQWHEGLSHWAAEVTCTDCGETFTTAGGGSSFWLACGEDGLSYTIEPEYGNPQSDCFCDSIEVTAGDRAMCPYCQQHQEVIHSRALRGGRTKRIMVVSVANVAGYAAILYWMIERNISEYGSTCQTIPMWAYVLGEKGGITKYRHGRVNGMFANFRSQEAWELCRDNRDMIDSPYGDWGSVCNRKKGAVVYPVVDSLIGTTGEKTGLYEMAAAGATERLLDYVKLQKKWKQAEIMVKEGFAGIICTALYEDPWGNSLIRLASIFDMGEKKPHRILGLTKAEYREGTRDLKPGCSLQKWEFEDFHRFRAIRQQEPETTPGGYIRYKQYFGHNLKLAMDTGEKLEKLRRYLEKTGNHGADVHLLADCRRMAQELYNRPLTEEEMWPRDLMRAHDALTAIITAQQNEKTAAMYAEGFREVKESFGHLEWTDGDLCLILPLSNADLVREGNVLRHCVGGYGKRHIDHSNTIWFVRHYRRPERPYYTLDIDMRTGKEVQLHGYGNERHGEHKEYYHSIPRKVRAFCDRWKREVLAPYIREQRKEKTA